ELRWLNNVDGCVPATRFPGSAAGESDDGGEREREAGEEGSWCVVAHVRPMRGTPAKGLADSDSRFGGRRIDLGERSAHPLSSPVSEDSQLTTNTVSDIEAGTPDAPDGGAWYAALAHDDGSVTFGQSLTDLVATIIDGYEPD